MSSDRNEGAPQTTIAAALPDSTATSRRRGRPSRVDAEQLGEHILDIATELFLTHGYGTTSIEAIAQRAQISKRTLYHRFDDKAALFSAVVHRIIDRLRPPADVPLVAGTNLQEVLQRLAAIIVHAALTPQAIALHRLIVAESARFPNLAAVLAQPGATDEAISLIGGLLEEDVRAGRIVLENPTFAAEQFLHMVVAVPQRRAMGLGAPMSASELDAWPRDVVNLFLNGCRGPASR